MMLALWITAAVASAAPAPDDAGRPAAPNLVAELDAAADRADGSFDPAAHARHAAALLAVGDAEQALAAADRAVALAGGAGFVLVSTRAVDPAAAERHALRGAALMALGDCRAGGAALDAALDADPECARAHLCVGHFACRTGQVAAAAAHFRAVCRADPGCAEARTSLGAARVRLGDPAGWADLDAGVRLAPRAAAGWEARAVARGESGDHAGAAADFAHTLRFEPRPASVAGLARARLFLGDYAGVDRAVSVGLAIIPHDPDRARLLTIRAEAHAARQDWPAARADLDRAAVYAPGAPDIIAARDGALARLDDAGGRE